MISDNLPKEYQLFASGKKIGADLPKEAVEKVIWSKGPYFEYPIFSYQRARMKQGKIIKDPEKIKNFNDVYKYEFGRHGDLLSISIGNEFGDFSQDIFVHSSDVCRFYSFDEDGEVLSVGEHVVVSNKFHRSQVYGQYGCREEQYEYVEECLIKVKIFSYEHGAQPSGFNEHLFFYQNDGLIRIDERYPTNEVEVIWRL
jgi:hypothetical protein